MGSSILSEDNLLGCAETIDKWFGINGGKEGNCMQVDSLEKKNKLWTFFPFVESSVTNESSIKSHSLKSTHEYPSAPTVVFCGIFYL